VAARSIPRQLICGALAVVLALLLALAQLTKGNASDDLPEPLADVLDREAEQRVRVAELLDGFDERATLRRWVRLVIRRIRSR
jgi:hypothetical protein